MDVSGFILEKLACFFLYFLVILTNFIYNALFTFRLRPADFTTMI
jgi:hypothetical protein